MVHNFGQTQVEGNSWYCSQLYTQRGTEVIVWRLKITEHEENFLRMLHIFLISAHLASGCVGGSALYNAGAIWVPHLVSNVSSPTWYYGYSLIGRQGWLLMVRLVVKQWYRCVAEQKLNPKNLMCVDGVRPKSLWMKVLNEFNVGFIYWFLNVIVGFVVFSFSCVKIPPCCIL